ncbi:altered inheritance of mitochondria protein 3-like [Homalodisca vitripennis]|uniref:altered inheritance of mitochondria protein 3-like n=1 Tax=Homalodisca vitripennis TaxID=197043 RepID=UPI001EEC0367|nr:altered inheritance of mitochondria protein 3-like [Homalodisca vitripennis]
MVFKKLICFCLVVAMVRSDMTEKVSSFIETSPTTSNSVTQNFEQLKKDGANPQMNGISPRSSGSLFGLGIGANLLGVHAGAGIGHGRGGYGDMGQGFVGKPAGSQYPQHPQYPQQPMYPQLPMHPQQPMYQQYPHSSYMQQQHYVYLPYYVPKAQ